MKKIVYVSKKKKPVVLVKKKVKRSVNKRKTA
jgi:hypothetical protein